jgi:hypothetical protein
MPKVGRPSKLTDGLIRELENRFRDGATNLEAIEGLISEDTFYTYLKTNQEFSERMELAKEYTTEIARAVVSRAIKRGDRESAKWWLERRNKEKFSTRSEVTGKDGKDLVDKTMSDEELDAIIERAESRQRSKDT